MGTVHKLHDTSIPGTGMELLEIVKFTNGTGVIMYVLCQETVSKQITGYFGVADPNKKDFINGFNVAKFGSKLSKRDADYHFGVQENYKYP